MKPVYETLNAGLGNKVECPDKNAHDNNASDDNQGVLQNLLRSGPHDLLQLALQLAEVSANATQGSLEPVFLFDFCHSCVLSLFGLVVSGVLSAESAVLAHFETVRVVLLVFHGIVVSLLALGTSQSDFYAHYGTSLILPPCITPASKDLEADNYIPPGAENGHNNKALFSQVEPFYHIICI